MKFRFWAELPTRARAPTEVERRIPLVSQAAASAKAPEAFTAPPAWASTKFVAGTAEVRVPWNSKTPLETRDVAVPDRLTGPVKVTLPPRTATGQVVAPPTIWPAVAVMVLGTTMSSVRLKAMRPPEMVTAPAPREPVVEVARVSTEASTVLRPTKTKPEVGARVVVPP